MTGFAFNVRLRFSLTLLAVCAVSYMFAASKWTTKVAAQVSRPVLVSEANSTRALAFDSVTHLREPFAVLSPIKWSADANTRVMLFALNLSLMQGEEARNVLAFAEDAAHVVHPLTVEYVGAVPQQEWMSAVVLRLSDDLKGAGDV